MPQHVLLFIADDWDRLAKTYGNDAVQTPHLDRLAKQGVTFDHAFCSSPSCAVSRATIYTGLHSHRHQQYGHCHSVHGFNTRPTLPTLPRLCAEQGVRCTLVGKDHVAPRASYPWAAYPADDESPAHWRRLASRFFAHDGPTCTVFASQYPHRRTDPSGWGVHDRHADFPGVRPVERADVTVPGFLPDHDAARRDLAGYYEAIGRFDAQVGAVLEALDDAGRADDTLVLATCDHAMPFPGAKASCYDTGHRVPLIVRRPGRTPPPRCDALVNHADLLPTACDWLEIDPPEETHGRNWLTAIDAPDRPGWDETHFSHNFHEVQMYDPYRVLRGRRHKLVQRLAHTLPMPMPSDLYESPTWTAVRNEGLRALGQRDRGDYEQRPAEALYDIVDDPMETRNLLDDTHATDDLRAVADDMKRRLIQWRLETRDPWCMLDYQRGDPLVPSIADVQM